MKPNRKWRLLLIGLCLCLASVLRAQDALPACPACHPALVNCDTLVLYSHRTDTLPVPQIVLPDAFREVQANVLTDSVGLLRTFWEQLRELRLGLRSDTLHIVHVGDSHIRGHYFPRATGALMQQAFGALKYTDVGINGAFCVTFTRPDRLESVVSLHPDLVILSFGTNESHNRRYNSMLHYRQMEELVGLLRDSLPGVPMLMTTPPGSYESILRRGRRRTYQVNTRTETVVNTIRRFADDNGLAVWNMYHILGGRRRACLNWWESGLMRPDHIHYLAPAYELQGQLFYQALIKAYNDYVEY